MGIEQLKQRALKMGTVIYAYIFRCPNIYFGARFFFLFNTSTLGAHTIKGTFLL